DDEDRGAPVLEEAELNKLVDGFKTKTLYVIVAVGALTGMRRGEIAGLKWSDFDPESKTLRITRSLEYTAEAGLQFKVPKSKRGRRTITIDDGLVGLLLKEKEKHLRIAAGVPATADVDLSLIKLPAEAMIFPSPDGTLTTPRHPSGITTMFGKYAPKLGFPGAQFKSLRASHGTLLLDKGVPVHVVATRLGHDPVILLKHYAKRTRKSDQNAAAVIAQLSRNLT
ncbi:MAG TPA: site-specific integrase, partial [Xanthobacteraceae bacterium]